MGEFYIIPRCPNKPSPREGEGTREGRVIRRRGGEEREERGEKEAYLERLDEVRLAVEQNRALVGADVDVARV